MHPHLDLVSLASATELVTLLQIKIAIFVRAFFRFTTSIWERGETCRMDLLDIACKVT